MIVRVLSVEVLPNKDESSGNLLKGSSEFVRPIIDMTSVQNWRKIDSQWQK